jgi:hypothetical protein
VIADAFSQQSTSFDIESIANITRGNFSQRLKFAQRKFLKNVRKNEELFRIR